jgi:hypothetical protein
MRYDPSMRRTSLFRVGLATVALVAAAAAGAAAQIPKPFGNFVATRAADPVDASNSSSAFSTAKPNDERDAAIAWRCMSDGLNVIYLSGKEFDDVEDVLVQSHVDDDAPSPTAHWTMMRGHRAVYLPPAEVLRFTQRAIAGKTLLLHVTDPHDGHVYTEEFSLAGLPGALDYILPCGTAR